MRFDQRPCFDISISYYTYSLFSQNTQQSLHIAVESITQTRSLLDAHPPLTSKPHPPLTLVSLHSLIFLTCSNSSLSSWSRNECAISCNATALCLNSLLSESCSGLYLDRDKRHVISFPRQYLLLICKEQLDSSRETQAPPLRDNEHPDSLKGVLGYQLNISDPLLRVGVLVLINPLHHSAQVHWLTNNVMVIRYLCAQFILVSTTTTTTTTSSLPLDPQASQTP